MDCGWLLKKICRSGASTSRIPGSRAARGTGCHPAEQHPAHPISDVDAVSGSRIKPDAYRYHNPTKVDILLFALVISLCPVCVSC